MAESSISRRWILLLRGINVGGAGRMPMVELRECLADAGFQGVLTYIQSGNVVLDAPSALDLETVRATSADAIEARFGFRPSLHVLAATELETAIAANPYSERGDAEPRTVHFFFVRDAPTGASVAGLADLAIPGEEFTVGNGVVYLLAAAGIGQSKLARALATRLGADTTARNQRSVAAVAALAG